ncbi:MAG: type II CAAX endopeptidase family protein [Roseiflexaceae bacterium]
MFTNLTNSAKACLFFVLTFGLTVVVSLLYPLLGEMTVFIHMYTPTLAALIMMLVVTRDGYSKAGWATLGLHHPGLRWWLLAILWPLVVISAVYGIVWNTEVAQAVFPDGSQLGEMASNMAIGLGISSALALGEEIGFRAYLLPRLMHLGTGRALLLSGLLHAIWHFPLMLLTPVYPILGSWLIVGPIILLTLTTAGVFYGYLQLTSKSVWPTTLAHGTINLSFELFAELTLTTSPLALEYLAGETGVLTLVATALSAAALLYHLRQRRSSLTVQQPSGV